MKAQTNQSQENKGSAVANNMAKPAFNGEQFTEMHPEAIPQRSLQQMANNSPQVKQLRSYQAMANDYISKTAQKKDDQIAPATKKADKVQLKAGGVVQRIGPVGMGLVVGAAGFALGGIPGGITGLAIGALAGAFMGGSKPTLTAAGAGNEQEGPCGSFQRVRNWQVQNPVQGIIVQKVTRTFNVRQANGTVLSGAAIDNYVTGPNSSVHATETQYWELWTVDAAGTVSDGGNDTFGLCAIIPRGRAVKNTTIGTFKMTGEAKFYPTNDFPLVNNFGFAQGAVNSAGGLYSRFTNPDGVLPASSGPTVSYAVNVAWDSTDPAPNSYYSKVT